MEVKDRDFYLSALSIFYHETFQTCATYLFLFHFILLIYINLCHTPLPTVEYSTLYFCNLSTVQASLPKQWLVTETSIMAIVLALYDQNNSLVVFNRNCDILTYPTFKFCWTD